MVPLPARRPPLFRAPALPRVAAPPRAAVVAAALGLMALVSLLVRTRAMHYPLWIDEGLSVGISSFPFSHIPEVLRQDGSPPLYYLLLHLWMAVDGHGEGATRVPSLVFSLLTIPAGFWAGRSMFDERAGWFCAGVFALSPFVTTHAQETRMYALIIVLGLVATAAFVHAFVFERRRYLPLFSVALALMLYTHNWSIFFAAGAAGALAVVALTGSDRRRVLRDGLLAFAGTAVLFAPWVPTLVFQTLHTGAPWSIHPGLGQLLKGYGAVLGGPAAAVAIILAGGSGLGRILERPSGRELSAVLSLVALSLGTVLSAWLVSQASPAWAIRYLAVVVGPLLLLAGVALSRAGRLGIAAVALAAVFWVAQPAGENGPTTERAVLSQLDSALEPGDLVVSTHPERLAVLAYYLPPGVRYATTLGPVRDPRVMDWRDALPRLERTKASTTFRPLLDRLPRGKAVLLVRPVTINNTSWNAPWTSLVRRRSRQWSRAVRHDHRFVKVAFAPSTLQGENNGVTATLYLKARP